MAPSYSPEARDPSKEIFHTQIRRPTDAGARRAATSCPQDCTEDTFHTKIPDQNELLEVKNPPRHPQARKNH